MGRVTGLKAPEQKLSDGITPSVVEGFASDVWIGGVDSRIYAPNNPMLAGPRESSTNSCCKDSLAVIVEKEYQSVSKQINNHAFSSSPSISCTILGTFLKIQNINENDLAKLELLVPSYQNYGINFIISLAAVKVVLIDLTPNADVRVAGLNQIMNNYIQYNEARHESSVGKFKPFTYDVNDSKFNQSVPQITDTLSEVDVHCLTTYGHVKNYDIVLVFSNEGAGLRNASHVGGRSIDARVGGRNQSTRNFWQSFAHERGGSRDADQDRPLVYGVGQKNVELKLEGGPEVRVSGISREAP